jgi:hypothetical protein
MDRGNFTVILLLCLKSLPCSPALLPGTRMPSRLPFEVFTLLPPYLTLVCFTFYRQSVALFRLNSETTGIISLYSCNWLIFIKKHAVYCAVRHKSLNINPANLGSWKLKGLGFISAQFAWDLWWRKWHSDKYLSEHFIVPFSVLFYQCWICLSILVGLLSGRKATKLGNFPPDIG